jgi:hypothetical protein
VCPLQSPFFSIQYFHCSIARRKQSLTNGTCAQQHKTVLSKALQDHPEHRSVLGTHVTWELGQSSALSVHIKQQLKQQPVEQQQEHVGLLIWQLSSTVM